MAVLCIRTRCDRAGLFLNQDDHGKQYAVRYQRPYVLLSPALCRGQRVPESEAGWGPFGTISSPRPGRFARFHGLRCRQLHVDGGWLSETE